MCHCRKSNNGIVATQPERIAQPERIEEVVDENTMEPPKVENIPKPIEKNTSGSQEPSLSHVVEPLFLERLEMRIKPPKFDLVSEVRYLSTKISLLQ